MATPRILLPFAWTAVIDVKRISDTVVEIIPKEPLAPGQYVLGGPPAFGVYGFGVEASKAK